MKKTTYVTLAAFLTIAALHKANAQQVNWRTAGNTVAAGQKLGANNAQSLLIVTDSTQRMLIDDIGNITMGLNGGGAKFLQFGTSFWMKFPQSQYIFRHSNSQEGLYFNQPSQRIEYRDQVSVPNMWVQWASTGKAYFRGNVGIGTEAPEGKLHVLRASAGTVTANANAPLVVENSTSNYINLLTPNASERGILFGDNLNAQDGGIIYGNVNLPDGLQFRTNGNVTRMSLTATGNLGVGTPLPEANLHIFRGSAGTVTANANAPLVVENSTSNYINLLTPSANERGILFGDNLNAQDGGIIYTGTNNQLQFRTNGNISRMFIDDDGNTGINLDPINAGLNAAKLQVRNDGRDNLRLVANDNANDWSIFSADGSDGDLFLYKNGTFKGFFDATTGLYMTSDKRLKKDIIPVTSIMENVMKLQPKKYHFIQDPEAKKYSFGFIAQDVNEIFPEFVATYTDRKTGEERLALNYDNFGVIAIKAIQEQQMQINEQKKEIEELKKMVLKLTSAAGGENIFSGTVPINSAIDVMLEQNQPNPFNQNTIIRYKIPANANAQMLVYDATGLLVKTLQAPESGQVQIHSYDLKPGVYTYRLSVNGKPSVSRKMVIAK